MAAACGPTITLNFSAYSTPHSRPAACAGSRLGGLLTPAVEIGGRYDRGEAETGAGLAGGGSLSYSLPAWGLTLTAAGQGLLAHEQAGFREWGVAGTVLFDPGAPGRGIALRLWTLADASAAAWASIPACP